MSSINPVSSLDTSISSSRRRSSPSASKAIANAPTDTPASPVSKRASVPGETSIRAAKSAVGIRRFLRAIRMSLPRARKCALHGRRIGF